MGETADGQELPRILFTRPNLFELRQGGNLKLANLLVDGELAPDSVGNSMLRTTSYPIQSNMRVELDGVTVRDLAVNKSFNVLTMGKSAFANSISVRNSNFVNISGMILSAASETEDFGQYNVEYLDITDSNFASIGGPIADVYRGGRDESTFGPNVAIRNNNLYEVGLAATNTGGGSIHLHGVQIADIANNNVASSAPFRVVHTVGTPSTKIQNNLFADTPDLVLEELIFEGPHRASLEGNEFAPGDAE